MCTATPPMRMPPLSGYRGRCPRRIVQRSQVFRNCSRMPVLNKRFKRLDPSVRDGLFKSRPMNRDA